MRHFLPACVLVSVIAGPALAETEHSDLDEVIVTASRRPAATNEISLALSLVDRDDVLSQKLTTDALMSQIGVYLQQTTPGQGAAIIRGLKGSAVLHLVDGMPLSNAIFRSAPTPYLSLVPNTAVDRVEVIRGTPASLYGSQAVGGVVQVVSRIPSFEEVETQVRRDLLMSFDTAELLKSIRGVVDVGDKRLAASFSAEYLTTGDRRIGGGTRVSPSNYTSKAARFVISATPSDDQSWLFDVQLLEQPKTPRIDELVPGFGQTQPSSSEFFFAPSQRLFTHARHTTSDALLGLDWRVDAAWQRIVDDRISRDYEATTRQYESNRSDLFALSISAAGESAAVSWIGGVDIQTDEVSSARLEQDIATLDTVVAQSRFPDGSRIDQAAIFGSAGWTVSQRHLINGGLRISDVQIEVPGTAVNNAASIDIRRLSGDVGWIYSFAESWQLLANMGVGFRAPNIFDLGTLGNRPGNRFNVPNIDLEEERVLHVDVGVRRRSHRVQFELMLYTLDFEDRITSVLTGDVTADGRDVVQSINAAESRIHGAEAGIDLDVIEKLSIKAVLNYTWGRQQVGTGPGEPADRIPPLNGRLAVRFDPNRRWAFESWLTVSGDQNRLSARDVRDVRINPGGSAGWAIIGATANWSPTDVWQITFSADNLLDKRYRVHGSGIDAPGRNFSIMFRTTW